MTSKNILLLGSTSFTGSHTLHNLQDLHQFVTVGRNVSLVDEVFDVYRDNIDELSPLLDEADIVINCFSNGDLDSCEKNPSNSKQLNYDFPKALCDQQKTNDFHLIHFSSNAVYDGNSPLYSEDNEHLPVNTYGRLKSQADKYLKRNSDRCTILRPITMYGQLLGKQRHNPFSFFFEKLSSNQNIIAVNDVYVNMLHVDVLVNCIEKVIESEIYGEFNISGDDIVNRFEFVSHIKNCLPKCTSVITETDSSGFETLAKRPLNTSFDNSQMKNTIDVHPEPLDATIKKLTAHALDQINSTGEQNLAA